MAKFLFILATLSLMQWAVCRTIRWIVLRPVDRRRPPVQDGIKAMLRSNERYLRGGKEWRMAIGSRWAELCVCDMGEALATRYLAAMLRSTTSPLDDFDQGVQLFLKGMQFHRVMRNAA